ncbi:MAG TPA: 2-C-methyl-D-erythritol 2,4-cyclodiphosphate synthase [Elusimicrobiota bacterium]|nr:2-C-methyl-D-erythritol 2,4-cyclodiphosphate synthase [Elusimicrobiota bacterium]
MTRTGWGYDSHRFIKGRRLVLGGVLVPFEKGLKGHSDADVLLHAVIDAVLGACALGDIGTLFPDTDPRFKDVSSLFLLREAVRLVSKRFSIRHIDVTLLAEAPRLGPYRQRIRAKVARAAGLPVEDVSVKAKTNEGMGFVGRREGLAAAAVATVEDRPRRR